MDWLNTLLSWFASFSYTLAVWAAKSEGWLWPLNALAPFFRALSTIADGLYGAFKDFVLWVQGVQQKIVEMVTRSWVWDFFRDPLSHLNQLWVWFSGWASNVTAIVTNWWLGVQSTVLGWVDAAKTYALGLVNDLQGVVNSLQSRWNNFTGTVLPSLASRFDVDQMIKSALTSWFPFYNDLVKLWDEIKAFFVNPVEFIWQKFTNWFFGGS